MKSCPCLAAAALLISIGLTAWTLTAAELVHAKDGSGVYGYNDTPVLPWCGYRVHDADRPNPRRVDPGPALDQVSAAPADAVVLFDGKDLTQWQPSKYKVLAGCIEAGPGNLTSK